MSFFSPDDKQKASIDFKKENFNVLNAFAAKFDESKSTIVNLLLSNFLGLSDNTQKELAILLHNLSNSKEKEVNNDGFFASKETTNDIQKLNTLVLLLNDGKNIENLNMATTYLKTGKVIYPADWIVAGRDTANEHNYCGVIEFRNGTALGLPHILYFTDYHKTYEYPEGETERIYKEIIDTYPYFKELLNQQVKPIYKNGNEPSYNPNDFINMDEWEKAPTIGMFAIPERGERNQKAVYGCEIIREEA